MGDMRVDELDEEADHDHDQELEDSQDQNQETTTLQAFLNESANLNKNLRMSQKRSDGKNLSNMHASKPSKIPVSKVSKKNSKRK